MVTKTKNRILALDPVHFRELDGVVFDEDSFTRHCAPHPKSQTSPAPETVPIPEVISAPIPQVVFDFPPVHVGWYPIEVKTPAYPIMAKGEPLLGSGSSSFSMTSWQTSWLFGSYLSSGSFYGSFSSVSSGMPFGVGGYGLELI